VRLAWGEAWLEGGTGGYAVPRESRRLRRRTRRKKPEPFVEAGDVGLLLLKDELQLLKLVGRNGNRVDGGLTVAREHQEIVGISDELHASVLQREIEIF